MASNERAALIAAIRERIDAANRLMPIAQRFRFPGAKHPPMLWHWHEDWDDMPTAELLDVCAWINEIVGRLERRCQ